MNLHAIIIPLFYCCTVKRKGIFRTRAMGRVIRIKVYCKRVTRRLITPKGGKRMHPIKNPVKIYLHQPPVYAAAR